MTRAMLAGLLLTLLSTGASATSTDAAVQSAQAECDRLISALSDKTPAEAKAALETMSVHRKGGQYQACVDAAPSALNLAADQSRIQVDRLSKMEVFTGSGIEIGDVDRVVRDQDDRIYVLVTYRAPRWPANKQVALPLDRITLQDGRLIVAGIGDDQLRAMASVPSADPAYRPLSGDAVATVRRSTASSAGTGSTIAEGLGGAKLEVREKQPFGPYLTDSAGRALYMFTADKAGESNCHDRCAEIWPPFITSETPRRGDKVNDRMVDFMKRRDGKLQVTYNTLPLYYYVKDEGPGTTTGQDVKDSGGEWYLVSPSGKPIHHGKS